MSVAATAENHEPVRIAIVGTGNIARIHARELANVTAENHVATIVACCDTDEGRLSEFRDEFKIPAGYRDLGDLLRLEHPDLVHVRTPPGSHCELALGCLRGGSSVLAEKPPAISLREFDELAAAEAGEGPPWFATVFQHRFGSGERRLRNLISRNALGRPLVAVCRTTWYRDQAYFDVPWRGRWATEGGGPTMGHGIHQMDLLLDALGDWAQVSALTGTLARRMETEDVSLAHVTFASGAAVTAWPSDSAWLLAFETTMRNVSGADILIGSPTTEGRPDAGYGGLFWRGPRSFAGGRVIAVDGDGGDELMGVRSPWLAFRGRHDVHGRWSTLIFSDARDNFSFPSQWFVRSTPYACLCPAPFFDSEYEFAAGASLTLRYGITVADGELDAAACARLSERAGTSDPLPAWE